MTDIRSDDRYADAYRVRDRFRVEVHGYRWEYHPREEQANEYRLEDSENIDQNEPSRLTADTVWRTPEHEESIQQKCSSHACNIGDHYGCSVRHGSIKRYAGQEIDQCGDSASHREFENPRRSQLHMATLASLAPVAMLSLIERSSG